MVKLLHVCGVNMQSSVRSRFFIGGGMVDGEGGNSDRSLELWWGSLWNLSRNILI